MAAHACDSNTEEAEAGGSGVPGHPGLDRETLSQNTQTQGQQPQLTPQDPTPALLHPAQIMQDLKILNFYFLA